MNENWYARNATRYYPIDDLATNRDDDGASIPSGIIVDCRVMLPYEMLPEVWISGLSLTDHLAAIVLVQGADAPQAIATLTLPQTITPFRTYWMKSLVSGVTAAVAFGDATARYVGRCTNYNQSRLLASTLIRYRPAAVTSMKKRGLVDALAGSIQLQGSGSLMTQTGAVVVDGKSQPAIVFKLSDDVNKFDVMREMGGPCAKRPDSNSCDRAPVETIGGVAPDCMGSIGLQVIGATTENLVEADGVGIAIYHPVGLTDMCARINKTYVGEDECNPEPPIELEFPEISSVSVSSAVEDDCTGLPYSTAFDEENPEFWEPISGNFAGGGGYHSNCIPPNYPFGASILHSCAEADPTNRIAEIIYTASYTSPIAQSGYVKIFTGIILGWRPYSEFYGIGSVIARVNGATIERGPAFDIEVRKFLHMPPTSTQESRLTLSGGVIAATSSTAELREIQRNDFLNPGRLTQAEVIALGDLSGAIRLTVEMSQVVVAGAGSVTKTRLAITQRRASGIRKTLSVDIPSIGSPPPHSKFGVMQWQGAGTITSFSIEDP